VTPAQWAQVLRAGWRSSDANSELERVLAVMKDEARKIAEETE